MTRGLADLARLDATSQLLALGAGRIGAAELLEASAARAEATADVNAVVRRDLERARPRARSFDDRRARGEAPDTLGRLAGLPLTLSDNFDMEHMAASAGDAALAARPAPDSAVAARLRDDGAVVWGKTNVSSTIADAQTFNASYGATANPWDLARTAGGSSGGAAAAVATGVSPFEVGSDLIGGLIVPASFCGVFAHRPTAGLVPLRGHVPPKPGTVAEPDLLAAGPFARSARDLRLALALLTSSPLAAVAQPATLTGLKVALWTAEPAFALDGEVRRVVEAFAGKLADEGVAVEPVEHLIDVDRLREALSVLLFAGAATPARPRSPALARLARALGAGPFSPAGAALAAGVSHRTWLEANEVRARLELAMRRIFAKFEVILAPCVSVPPFAHDRAPAARRRVRLSDGGRADAAALMDWPALACVCGLPVTVVPAGLSAAGLPVGVQVIGPRGGDSRTLAAAQAVDERIAGFVPPPLD